MESNFHNLVSAVGDMADRYLFRLGKDQRKLYEAWDRFYSATPWKIERNIRISEVQGWMNPYVSRQPQG
ncbi:HNH endonuclease family protein [Endozoicomonas numazuensis]|uniref:Uncharacterized protein n=1 Tax=Endozoicomonas numazuensis TaxID=1137799 RepID=A0A081NGZ3_9GAMM|nr:hypothetical protein [Endozoicomonas numazuensis]KEQ17716.1 hypothetical protein GZ78_08480 [Endozoicomonas numazuensis]